MATTIATLTPAIVRLLGNRGDVAALATQQIADTIVELSDNYPFERLRETGPVVQFSPGVNTYKASFFVKPAAGDAPQHIWNKTISWFFYLQPPVNLTSVTTTGYSNPGYNLIFRDIEDLEVLTNTLSLPQFWSQLGEDSPDEDSGDGNLIVAATPQQAYYTYQRYQFLHPFSYPAVSADPILLPLLWYDIIQYAAAERIALQLRMEDVADRYHKILFGDPEFERSSGGRGQPGLIFRRISQTQKNQSRSTRSVRMIRSRY